MMAQSEMALVTEMTAMSEMAVISQVTAVSEMAPMTKMTVMLQMVPANTMMATAPQVMLAGPMKARLTEVAPTSTVMTPTPCVRRCSPNYNETRQQSGHYKLCWRFHFHAPFLLFGRGGRRRITFEARNQEKSALGSTIPHDLNYRTIFRSFCSPCGDKPRPLNSSRNCEWIPWPLT